MTFHDLCQRLREIRETRKTSRKVRYFADALAAIPDEADVRRAVAFAGEGGGASIGHATIAAVACRHLDIDPEEVFLPCRLATGSSSEAIRLLMENLTPPPTIPPPTLAETEALFAAIRTARNRVAKETALIDAFTKLTPLETQFFLRMLGRGSLRIGFELRSILQAVALAFGRDPEVVRYAHTLTGSLADTASLAFHDRLADATFRLFQPIAFMLASPIEARTPDEATRYVAEPKFDGMRAQLHAAGHEARLYSRDLNDITGSFPDITRPIADVGLPPIVLDGEICGYADKRILPFNDLQKRMGVKSPSKTLLAQVPAVFVAFDLLHHAGSSLFAEPWAERRRRLEAIPLPFPLTPVQELTSLEDIPALFERSLADGNEGLMVKRADSPYEYGQRRASWLKVKRPGGSLDTVILYATAGSGRRGGTWSDFTLGIDVSDDDRYAEDVIPIGKAYGGYTDAELKELNRRLKPLVVETFGPTSLMRPEIVVEIEFDEIQVNRRAKAGYTLRFPRFKAIRWEKTSHEIDTLSTVERLYDQRARRHRSEFTW
jgi:DNA ligase-1